MGTETQIEMPQNGIENKNGVKKKIVYNMYRDMLKTYNGRANEILETKPINCSVTEDRGIIDRVENMARQTPDAMSAPPPPPLALGAVPAVRLKSEISEHRPEPPACVQNAMLTKDKKPFTYTPGGLDLSQIRSPRMAKRVSRNAQAEGVGAVPQSPLAGGGGQGPPPPPQGFPGGIPPPPPPPGIGGPMPPPPPPGSNIPRPPPPSNLNNLPPYTRPDIKIPENPMNLLRKTGGPVLRPSGPVIGPDEQITKQPIFGPHGEMVQPAGTPVQSPLQSPLVQAPSIRSPPVQSPGVQMQPPAYRPVRPPQQVYQPSPQPQVYQPPQQVYQPSPQPQVYQPPQQQPSEQNRPEARQQVGTLYIPPLSPEELQPKQPQSRGGAPESPQSRGGAPESPNSPMDTLKKAPTPWLTNRGNQQQRHQEVPAWAKSPPESANSTAPSTPATPGINQNQAPGGATRVIPVRVDRNEDEMNKMQQQFHQQFQQQFQQQVQQQQQQMFKQMQQQHQPQLQPQQIRQQYQQQYQQQSQQQQHVVRVIPIQIEGRTNAGPMSPTNNVSTPFSPGDMLDGPVQSPTFRILQRVTSRDEEIHAQPAVPHHATTAQPFTPPPTDQVRRLQLSDDDQKLMNRVKNQVDGDVSLHSEEDPRYRGPAIPSKAFRLLQSMTDAAEASGDPTCVPRAVLVQRGPPGGFKRNQAGTPAGENNLPPSEQRAPEPRKYTGSAIPSRSFQMLQAMVAPENCAGSDENSYPYDPYYPYYDPMYPYWLDPYWAAYYQDPNAYQQESPNEESTNENTNETNGTPAMTEEEYYAQMQYWDPYYAYYYYGYYPPAYSPHAFYPSNETDDYSSTDEMAYYGTRFPRGPTPCGHVSAGPNEQVTPTDTEVEEINDKEENLSSGLQAIPSVSDIQVYNADEQSVTETEEENESDDSSCEDSDSTEDGEEEPEGHLPHQLSVIFEESEMSESERKRRETSVATTISEDDSSTTIGGGHCETDESCDEDLGETSVTVRLPLKLKFGKSDNGKEVTEVIVGDSEMEPNTPENSVCASYTMKSPITVNGHNLKKENSNETIDTNYETAEDSDEEVNNAVETNDEDTDFWEEINKNVHSDTEIDNTKKEIETTQNENVNDEEDEDDEDSSSSSDEEEEEPDEGKLDKDLRDAFTSDAVKEIVRKLREAGKLSLGLKEETVSVRQRIMAIENGTNGTNGTSRSSSARGCDYSEEDGDSGVTSDVSRHTDDESCEMKRKYERAATHSRLFQLLQEECAKSDDEDDEESENVNEDRRKQLSLPLSNSEASSGICSPSSPNWLARELVNGLLGGRQGHKFRSLPVEKLYAAAQRILQEDNTSEDGSPLDSYANDYKNYYNTWDEAGRCPSRLRPKCPRVKSEKNLHNKLKENEENENNPYPDSKTSCSDPIECDSPGRLMAHS